MTPVLRVQVSAMDFDVKSSELLRKTLPLYLAELYQYDPQDESKDVFHEIGIHGYVCSCVCIHVRICSCVCMYMYVHVCVYVCVYVHVHMYVRTYVCMYVLGKSMIEFVL